MPTLDAIKTTGRRQIHGLAAVSCDLVDPDHPDGLVFAEDYLGNGLTVRYHNRLTRTGDLDGTYGEVIDGIDKLVFNDENVAEVSVALVANGQAPLVLARGARVTIPSYKGLRFTLDAKDPADGPLETVWVVARSKG